MTPRVIYIPSYNDLKIVNLPHPLTGEVHNYLLSNETLYELREIDGDNPHDKNNYLRPLTKKDNLPVRSLILEGQNKEGLIIEEGNLIIPTKFNLVYTLISYFTSQIDKGKEFTRFQSQEDLFDMIQEGIPGLLDLPEILVKNALINICESVIESDEVFYKYSDIKCQEFLKSKISTITQNFPKTIKDQLIDPLLYPADLDEITPQEITNLALQRYSIHLLSSSLPQTWITRLTSCYNFQPMESYITDIQKKKAAKRTAEENLSNMNKINAENKRNADSQGKGPQKKKPVPVKKLTPKLSRGPLDMFMKKKK